jgi:hypothetical protein
MKNLNTIAIVVVISLVFSSCTKNQEDLNINMSENQITDNFEQKHIGWKKHWIGCQTTDGLGNPMGQGWKCTWDIMSNCNTLTVCDTIPRIMVANGLTQQEKFEISSEFAESWIRRGIIDEDFKDDLINDCLAKFESE